MENQFFYKIMTIISVAVLAMSACVSAVQPVVRRRRIREGKTAPKKAWFTPFRIFAVGFFAASFCLFLPVWFDKGPYTGDSAASRSVRFVFLNFYRVFRLLSLNEDFEAAVSPSFDDNALGIFYYVYSSFLFFLGPILTTGFVLSFFKEITARVRYASPFNSGKDLFVFSELNERSIVLATDAEKQSASSGRKCLLVFADYDEDEYNEREDLVARAEVLGAILTKRDVTEIKLKKGSKITRKIYLIGESHKKELDREIVLKALVIIDDCRKNPAYNNVNTHIYVFTSTKESEALLSSKDPGEMKVRRVNEVANFALSTLTEHSVFEVAKDTANGKEINIIIVGVGAYGFELIKTLCWLTQMPGYRLNLYVFDKDADIEDKLRGAAPELISYNGSTEEGQPRYKIEFFTGVDVADYSFQKQIEKLGDISAAYVTLGEDQLNIETAITLRVALGRASSAVPFIYTIVYSHEKNVAVGEARKEQAKLEEKYGISPLGTDKFGIKFIGDIEKVYSIANIERNELEKDGFERHMHWARISAENAEPEKRAEILGTNAKKYNNYEYHRRSSIASAVYFHQRDDVLKISDRLRKEIEEMEGDKIRAEISGTIAEGSGEAKEIDEMIAEKYESEIEKRVKYILLENEHIRWMAYMRTEGYVRGVRDDVAKTHDLIVPFKKLDKVNKDKDDKD